MTIKFGEIDANQILQNEYRIGILEGYLDWILKNNNAFVKELTEEEMDKIRQNVFETLSKKYPKSGLVLMEG